ncbi:Isoleucine--tRNA ligase, cytoplasmic, partial [Homalodisca vitripennis]
MDYTYLDVSGLTGVRDRCDSLPGRARTTSEGPHHHPAPRHLAPAHRPHSMYTRGISYSPPVGSSPVSPASGACSMTDSAGSSLSMDGDGDHWAVEGELRYGHSLTPEEPVIMEENLDDYAAWPAEIVVKALHAFEQKESVALTLIDLSKAFDCVNHGILLDKLKIY